MSRANHGTTGSTGRSAALGAHCQTTAWISGLASRGSLDQEASHVWLAGRIVSARTFVLVRFAWQDQPGELAMWSGADP